MRTSSPVLQSPASANRLPRSDKDSENDAEASSNLNNPLDRADRFSQTREPPAQSGPKQTQRVRFEHISAGEDAQHVIISTFRGSVYGNDVVVEERGTPVLGQLEDRSVQCLSADRKEVLLSVQEELETGDNTNFNVVYGAGHRQTEN